MADPRFFDNRGPFRLGELCLLAGLECPPGVAEARVLDVAGLGQAGPTHLSFFEKGREKQEYQATRAGWCLVKGTPGVGPSPPSTVLIPAKSVGRAFAVMALAFYPDSELDSLVQETAIHPTSRRGEGVRLGQGVLIGPGAEIGDDTRIGPGTVIGRGVTIGRNCLIGANATLQCAHIGDGVVIQSGAVVGGSGFGFSSAADGHVKIPQLGRVIVQDHVEIGSNSTVDRGALGDTVIGEGTKIDNLVQIGHNSRIGRHCVLAGQSGIAGSAILGDFVLLGGKVGVSDHVTIGDRARVAGFSGVGGDLDGGMDYGGIPARPLMQWKRESLAAAKLARGSKRIDDQ